MGSFEPSQEGLAPELRAFAAGALGPLTGAKDLSWDHGESQVWRVTAGQRHAVVKVHRQGRKFANEHAAYVEWLPRLRPNLPRGTGLPELIAVRSEHPRALLLEWVEGRPASSLSLPLAQERSLHRRAGAFLRLLHGIHLADDDPVPLGHAYRARLEAWSGRAQGVLDGRTVAAVGAEASRALPFVERTKRVACHRDYTPRNWLVEGARQGAVPEAPRLTVIDFEHARPDLHLTDLQRMWVGPWRHRPDLKEAFLKGYGRELSTAEEEALRRISALWALSTVVWAREHGDAEFEQVGLEALEWLGLRGRAA